MLTSRGASSSLGQAGGDAPPQPAGLAVAPPHDWAGVCADVLALHRLAQHLRADRFATGALRLDNTRLQFQARQPGRGPALRPGGGRR